MKQEDLELVREMISHPGWAVVLQEIEQTLGQAMLAALSVPADDVAMDRKMAYFRGKVDALWSLLVWHDTTLVEGFDAQVQGSAYDGVFKRVFKKILGGLIGK